jgi:hypothetical protein
VLHAPVQGRCSRFHSTRTSSERRTTPRLPRNHRAAAAGSNGPYCRRVLKFPDFLLTFQNEAQIVRLLHFHRDFERPLTAPWKGDFPMRRFRAPLCFVDATATAIASCLCTDRLLTRIPRLNDCVATAASRCRRVESGSQASLQEISNFVALINSALRW